MNPIQHARVSARRWGGVPDDYVAIHALIDSTKMLCTDNRHRILHTFWAVQEVVIPVFGHTMHNSAGREVDSPPVPPDRAKPMVLMRWWRGAAGAWTVLFQAP